MLRSVLSNWVGIAVSAVITLLMTPFLVHHLGAFEYGMWIVVASFLEHYGLLDVGIRTTLQRYVARFHGRREQEELNQTMTTALTLAVLVCIVIVGLSFAFAAVLPAFFKVTGPQQPVFARLVVLLGVSIGITFPVRVFGAYLCGLQRFDLYNLTTIISSTTRALSLYTVVRLGYGVVGCGWVALGIAVLSLICNGTVVRWADPALSLHMSGARWARLKELMNFSVFIFIQQVGDYFRFNLDAFVIARWLAVALITPFNVATRLIEYFRFILQSITGPLMTSFSSLDAQGKQGELQTLFLRATRITALGALLLASVLLVDGKHLLALWIGKNFVSSYSILAVLAVSHAVAVGQGPSVMFLVARGRNRWLAAWTLIEGFANLVLSILWAEKYGILGVALGTAVPMLFSKILVQPWYTLKVIGLRGRDYIVSGVGRPLITAALFLVIARFTAPPPDAGLLWVGAAVAWQVALYAGLAWIIGFTSAERHLLWDRLRNAASARHVVWAD